MSYSELIKDYSRIRDYMREFFVYGFKSREEYDRKSNRSYDNERRRIESWLGDYMAFRQDVSGKNVFISVDSRHVPHNPLYKSWKAASFTKNDISLHFLLMDILCTDQAKSIPEILACIDRDYLPLFSNAGPIDESTIRKKLKEYIDLGLIVTSKQGNRLLYLLAEDKVDLSAWQDALSFFSEENPLGVVGSYLLDKLDHSQDLFSFKHHYLLFMLDSDLMLDLLTAMREQRKVELELFSQRGNHSKRVIVLPMKLFISTQGGRQYLAGYNTRTDSLRFLRLDGIKKIRALEVEPTYPAYQENLAKAQPHLWGVATGKGNMEHVEMVLRVAATDAHIAHRLEREKRCGTVTQLDETTWRFTANVYDAQELLPWARTFMGRIQSFSCSNKIVEERFWSDYALMSEMYGGESNAVQ